jgi:hypothetical protein
VLNDADIFVGRCLSRVAIGRAIMPTAAGLLPRQACLAHPHLTVLMTVTHIEAAKWNSFGWSQNVTHARASSEGAVGVLYIWTDPGPPFDKPGASFVVKPLGGSALSTRFAEDVLKKVAGTDSPDSIELSRNSPGYAGIQTLLRKMLKANTITAARAAPYLSAGSFVLQKMMAGYVEMSDAYRGGPNALRDLINNAELMTNLGKLAAADLILGNGDRVEAGNFTNMMFNANGTFAAIDSASILASFKQLSDASDMPNLDHFDGKFMGHSAEERRGDWVTRMAKYGAAAPTDAQLETFRAKQQNPAGVKAPVLPPIATLSAVEQGKNGLLFDKMKEEFEGRIKESVGTDAPINAPTGGQWAGAKVNFVRGFEAGLATIDTLLGGKAWLKGGMFKAMKSNDWKQLKGAYKNDGYSGVDPNMSWLSLVVRREVYRNLRMGRSMQEAIEAGTQLAARKQEKLSKPGSFRVG